jgi:hypothetical protein
MKRGVAALKNWLASLWVVVTGYEGQIARGEGRMEKAKGRRWEVGKVKKSGKRCRVKGARLGSWMEYATHNKQQSTNNPQQTTNAGYAGHCPYHSWKLK